jgi:pimeloyl-ACP methyl ester carboxylesterase
MKLHVRTWGDDSLPKTAVLVHGIVGTSGTWRHLADALVPLGYRCVAPDLRAHGASPATPGQYSISAMAADLGESVPTEPDLLIGFSLGGGISIMAVQDGILQPKRLVAIDPALHKSDPAWAKALIDGSEQAPRTVQAVAAANPLWDIRDAEERAAAFQSADWDQMRQIMLDVPDWDVRGRLAALAGRIPTLLVLADPSHLVPPDDAKQIENALGPGSVVVRPNTTHSVHRDDFDGFLQAMLAWIGPR